MKKMLSILTALVMVLTLGAVSLAEEAAAAQLPAGVEFNMDLDQVRELVNLPNPEVEQDDDHGSMGFWKLEYERVSVGQGFRADVEYLFFGNGLTAIRYEMAEGTSYDAVKAELVTLYGEAVPFDAAKIGNGRYAVDDDGDLYDCVEMIETEQLIIVFERDREGDMDVTFLDPTAAYIQQ